MAGLVFFLGDLDLDALGLDPDRFESLSAVLGERGLGELLFLRFLALFFLAAPPILPSIILASFSFKFLVMYSLHILSLRGVIYIASSDTHSNSSHDFPTHLIL